MIPIVLLNLLAVGLGFILPNKFLMWHSYVLYGFQAATMLAYLLGRVRLVQYLFLPTLFVLVYSLVNLIFGSYLVPREFGWDKQFATAALAIRNYNLIVPFLMLSNLVLFVLSESAIRKLKLVAGSAAQDLADRDSAGIGMAVTVACFAAFLAVSYFEVYTAFSFQLAIVAVHLTHPSIRLKPWRYAVYIFYLLALAAFSYENKREIAMVMFLIVFLESYYSRAPLSFRLRSIIGYSVAAGAFFGLVMAASILRGYGDFPVASLVEALIYIPQYMTSDLFIDGLTDNLELNYNYGVTVTSMDYGLRSLIDYQYGATLAKVVFLPIPRDALAYKPESMMALFTQVYAPEWWSVEGSMPVMFASDMFLNFHCLGLVPFALVWLCVNKLFLAFHTIRQRTFLSYSCLFLFITVLMLARGSGLEQWLLYYFIAVPFFLLVRLTANSLRTSLAPASRWVV